MDGKGILYYKVPIKPKLFIFTIIHAPDPQPMSNVEIPRSKSRASVILDNTFLKIKNKKREKMKKEDTMNRRKGTLQIPL